MNIPDYSKQPKPIQDYIRQLENLLMDTVAGISSDTLNELLELDETRAKEIERDLSDLEAHKYRELRDE